MPDIAEYDNPDVLTFRDQIYPKAEPAILRGVGAGLEPVQMAKRSPEEFAAYLKHMIGPQRVNVLSAKSEGAPTFFFDGKVSKLNFERGEMPFPDFIDAVFGPASQQRMRYLESTKIEGLSPALAQALQLPLSPNGVQPLIWMGNKTGTHTHFDVQQNIAYVVSGKRRFTLFPPSQTPNLYMAPFESSPSNAPISMVQPEDPDFDKYPRFREALEHQVVAELEPGDALFIPYMWWHHVKALGELNVLVNYWWNEYEPMGSPLDAMLHGMLVLRDLPPPMREAWQAMFETFVFKAHGEPMEYIEPENRGAMGPIDEQTRMHLWRSLGSGLSETMQRAFGSGPGSAPRG